MNSLRDSNPDPMPLSESEIISELNSITLSLQTHPKVMRADIRSDLEERFEFIANAWTSDSPLTYSNGIWETPDLVLIPDWLRR